MGYRISVTTLESFRRFIAEASTYDTEESFLATLKGTFTGNAKTRFGQAYHKIIEGESSPYGDLFVAGGLLFHKAQILPALQYREAHPHITHEMNVYKTYDTLHFPIQVSGRVDVIEGIAVRDIKTKFRKPIWQEYIDSIQWKLYLDILEANTFYYDVFEVKGFDDNEEPTMYSDVRIMPHETLECVSYAAMQKDITDLLNAFLDFVKDRKLFGYLKPSVDTESLIF